MLDELLKAPTITVELKPTNITHVWPTPITVLIYAAVGVVVIFGLKLAGA